MMVANQYRVKRDYSGLRMQLKNEIFQAVLEGKELLVVKLAVTEREAGWQVLVVLEGEV